MCDTDAADPCSAYASVCVLSGLRRVAAKAYIFHDPDFLPFGLRLHSVTGRPVIYDCHENIPEDIRYGKDWIPPLLRPVVSVGFRMIENFIVRRLGRAIVTVPHLERRYKALGADVQLVRNFPRFSFAGSSANAFSAEFDA